MHEFTICITYLLHKPRRNVMKCLNQIMQFRQTVTTIFSMPSSQRSSAGHHPSEALPKDLVEVLAVLKQHSFTQENLEMIWVSCIIALHCMTREDSNMISWTPSFAISLDILTWYIYIYNWILLLLKLLLVFVDRASRRLHQTLPFPCRHLWPFLVSP